MITSHRETLDGQWRRLRDQMAIAQRTAGSGGTEARDAAAFCLDAIYALWESWGRVRKARGQPRGDGVVRGDPDGETTAALVFARGAKEHAGEEPGKLIGYGQVYGRGPYGGGWAWQPYDDPNPRWKNRNEWYRDRVRYRPLMKPLMNAVRWLEAQPEITP